MANLQVEAQVQLREGTQVEVTARDFSLIIDEPEALGGKNEGVNPGEALLGALGACQAIVARIYAEQFNVDLQGLRISLEADFDSEALKRPDEITPQIQAVRYSFEVDSPSSKESVDQLIAHLETVCPVGDTIANPVQVSRQQLLINGTAA